MFRVIVASGVFTAAVLLSWSVAVSAQEKKDDKKEENGALIASLKDGEKWTSPRMSRGN